jgi:hypothetical protein
MEDITKEELLDEKEDEKEEEEEAFEEEFAQITFDDIVSFSMLLETAVMLFSMVIFFVFFVM